MLVIVLAVFNLSLDGVRDALADSILQNAYAGVCIYSLKRDRLVFESNGVKLFIPASNQKIVTTAAALYYLGGDFRYVTRLKVRGGVVAGTLGGDIILEGSGDPSIRDCGFLERWADVIKAQNIHTVAGNIVADDRVFSRERLPEGWAWHYLDARYAAELSAFSFNGNTVRVTVGPAADTGDTAQFSLYPETKYVTVKNRLMTVDSAGKRGFGIYREPEANIIHIEGEIDREFKPKTIEIAVKDPAFFAAFHFKELLEKRGVKVNGEPKKYDPATIDSTKGASQLDSIISMPLSEIIKETNKESKNLMAENLLRSIGHYSGGDGSYWTSNILVRRFIAQLGGDTTGIEPVDGSGLSRHNLVSPYNIVVVLRYMYLSGHRDKFFESLPTSNEGTLFGRLLNLENVVRAKTGTLRWVSCMSGYVESPADNDMYAFSMLFNNYSGSAKAIAKLQERIIEEMRK